MTRLGVFAILSCLTVVINMLSPQADASQAVEQEMISSFESAMAKGDEATALKHVLDYSMQTNGEKAPETIKIMHRYGYALYKEGSYSEAIDVLKRTLGRSTDVYGETGGEAFEINMNLGNAYSQYRERWEPRLKYFDRALQILRERGEYESITYVATLVSIVINLLDSDSLDGSYSTRFSDTTQSEEAGDFEVQVESEYRGNFGKPEKYLLEAAEIGARLENMDEFISAKIAVLHAKLNVLKAADLASVPGGVDGRITRSAARDSYDREEERLATAIDTLARDTDTNRAFLEAANNILLQIAWLDKDEQRLTAMCAKGTVNSAGKYPPERLYEIMEGGMVFAPDVGIRVSTNIFKQRRSWRRPPASEKDKSAKIPYFKPVCIDGQLMAALIHAPRVTIEEIMQDK